MKLRGLIKGVVLVAASSLLIAVLTLLSLFSFVYYDYIYLILPQKKNFIKNSYLFCSILSVAFFVEFRRMNYIEQEFFSC